MRRTATVLACGIAISYLLPWQVYYVEWTHGLGGDPAPTRWEYISGLRLCFDLAAATLRSWTLGRQYWDVPINAVLFVSHLLPLVIAAVAGYRMLYRKPEGRFTGAGVGVVVFSLSAANFFLTYLTRSELIFYRLGWGNGFPIHEMVWFAGPLLCLVSSTAFAAMWGCQALTLAQPAEGRGPEAGQRREKEEEREGQETPDWEHD